ncbi:histone deacetylase [Micromonospora sp. WMMD1155]|uniref:histone deacetylase n=1 Tax=Micromonospora sp. WMMD1155 TaxID=3016094 RepID=UPI00249B7378|nr:histone deacetylase [Micromonospora sp. WMMD1155]WFE51327.1 histone deacetylase [Micromonospora sp. WMMD1155]
MVRVWYVAYGSNMHAARLGWYIGGGCPPGGMRTYPGCRDPRPPSRSVPVSLPGGIYFAGESRAWTGGMAFYDPHLPGEAAARAYLVTVEQFTDIAAQEMYRPAGEPAALTPATGAAVEAAIAGGRATLGPGRYETLVCPGSHGGVPMLTFTAPEGASGVKWRPPAPTYLGMIARGLRESHGWPVERIADYLAGRPGVAHAWSPDAVATLVSEVLADP